MKITDRVAKLCLKELSLMTELYMRGIKTPKSFQRHKGQFHSTKNRISWMEHQLKNQ